MFVLAWIRIVIFQKIKRRRRWTNIHVRWQVYGILYTTERERGGVCAFNQCYKTKICDGFLKNISEELKVKGFFYAFIETYLDYKEKHL